MVLQFGVAGPDSGDAIQLKVQLIIKPQVKHKVQ